jgi:C4-dicarboxylate-specific signal transduction histidine kinase
MVKFLTDDPRGLGVPRFVVQLADHLNKEHRALQQEHELLAKNIEHIKEIVAMQQDYARVSGFLEQVSLAQLMDDALQMNRAGMARHGIQVERHYAAAPLVTVDKHKVLQILVNLVNNAKYAMQISGNPLKRLEVDISANGDRRVKVVVKDNGVGIPPANLTRVFAHGFTTRKDGHGFGLHSGANAAKEMGGVLKAHSDGIGKGAAFTLELPFSTETNNS